MNSVDPYNLERFVTAQRMSFDSALDEIRNGHKRSHWMWFIFPQFAGLGHSSRSIKYSIKSVAEAKAYLTHDLLGPRLLEIARATLAVDGRSALEIFGAPDDVKLQSCATLFAQVSPNDSAFHALLGKYFDGQMDVRTLQLMDDR
ncbi:MAG: DUF1810 domain-containing protein [Gemmatimonas sp.]